MTDDLGGFNHAYPARECPGLDNGSGWTTGYYAAHNTRQLGRPLANPYRHSSDEWRGFEFGTYEGELLSD